MMISRIVGMKVVRMVPSNRLVHFWDKSFEINKTKSNWLEKHKHKHKPSQHHSNLHLTTRPKSHTGVPDKILALCAASSFIVAQPDDLWCWYWWKPDKVLGEIFGAGVLQARHHQLDKLPGVSAWLRKRRFDKICQNCGFWMLPPTSKTIPQDWVSKGYHAMSYSQIQSTS